jgi:hypothetical protein
LFDHAGCLGLAQQQPVSLTAGGQVTNALSAVAWGVYAKTNASIMATGSTEVLTLGIWAGDIGGQLDTSHPVGSERICVLSRETNGRTLGHASYYAVMNHVLTADDPAVSTGMTLRAIPVPAVVSGQPAHLNWPVAVEDPGEAGATNIIGYNVFRSTDGISFSMINTAIVTQLAFDDPIPNDRGHYYALGLVYRGSPPVPSAALSANSAKTVIVDSDSDSVPDWWMLQ